MKIVSDFGNIEVKPLKTFVCEGLTLCIINRPEKYMNSIEPLIMKRVVEYTTGRELPLNINHKETLKSIQEKAGAFMVHVASKGKDIKGELAKFETLNK